MAVLHDVVLAVAPTGLAAASAATWYFRRAAIRANATLEESREQNAALGEEIEFRDQEVAHLTAVRLPALMAIPGSGDLTQAGPLLHPQLSSTQFGRASQAVLRQASGFVRDVETRTEKSVQAQVRVLLQPLLALAARQQSATVRLLAQVADEEVLAHAFAVDHGATLLAQRMHIIGVLLGDEVSSPRPDLPLMDVLSGATSRVQDYQRVAITNRRDTFVRGRVAEPIAIALAELMENGTRHSSPGSPVSVWFMEAPSGLNLIVDSIGPMLSPDGYERAAAVLPGQYRLPLATLGTRLGFPAVGALARQHGFQVWLDPHHRRGVRAILHLPGQLLVQPPVLDEPLHHSPTVDETDVNAARAGAGQRMAKFSQAVRSAGHGQVPSTAAVQGAAGTDHGGGRFVEHHGWGQQ
ncbi:ATP-binding protein [Streptomyces sp. NPDC048270]|uniref:ATP-binding protein n=1 Tax=Streptomyces sp. NPDC048270 TaxID=3154615 RepID=UPI0033FF6B5B